MCQVYESYFLIQITQKCDHPQQVPSCKSQRDPSNVILDSSSYRAFLISLLQGPLGAYLCLSNLTPQPMGQHQLHRDQSQQRLVMECFHDGFPPKSNSAVRSTVVSTKIGSYQLWSQSLNLPCPLEWWTGYNYSCTDFKIFTNDRLLYRLTPITLIED